MAKALTPTGPHDWVRLVRRARLGSTVKLIALLLADYASKDGSDVRPGIPRLANVAEVSERTVMRALASLREIGLIDRTFEGASAGRRGLCDEYQLTIPDDLLESLPMLDPQESRRDDSLTVLASNQVTSETEQVTSETGTGDTGVTPPNQGPLRGPHLTTPPNQDHPGFSDHLAKLEYGPVIVAENEKADLDSADEDKRYKAASTILARLPDLGAAFMVQAESETPDATLKQRVIQAAQLCVMGIPA